MRAFPLLLLCAACAEPARDGGAITNGTVFEDLATLPLASDSLRGAGLRARVEADIGAGLFEYLVQCALREDQSLTVRFSDGEREIRGSAGYAAQWADGPCDEACQEWVSACLMSRINAYGVTARIWLAAPGHPDEIDNDDPADDGYSVQEGAFYGNFFANPPRLYACRGKGRDPLYDTFRVCTHPGSPCGLLAVGNCETACESEDALGFRRCVDRPNAEGARTYERVVTTYLPRTAFGDGASAGVCGEGLAPGDHLPSVGFNKAGGPGARCTADAGCDEGLVCSVNGGPGTCTVGCEGDDDCRGAICDGGSLCREPCTSAMSGGAGCGTARICTGYHLFADTAGRTACFPFCETDEDCGGSSCNPRSGLCGVKRPPADELKPDGEPCLSPDECRGFCLPFGTEVGLCASWLEYAGGEPRCPDAGVVPYFASSGMDDLGACLFRACTGPRDCTSPLTCMDGVCTVGP